MKATLFPTGGVLYGQEIQSLHLMRIGIIIVQLTEGL
jgi:hypothetical protein